MIAPKIAFGDLVLENNDFVMVEGDEELVQSVQSNLKTRKGEWFLDENFGLDRTNILEKNNNKDLIHDDIVEACCQDERIATVEELVITDNRHGRSRLITLRLMKDNGDELPVEGVEI